MKKETPALNIAENPFVETRRDFVESKKAPVPPRELPPASETTESEEALQKIRKNIAPKSKKSKTEESQPEPEPKKTKRKTFLQKLSQNRLAKVILVSLGLHTPLIPEVGRHLLKEKERAEEIMRLWNESDMVIRPQGEKARKEVARRRMERARRADVEGIKEYKQRVREKMDNGEPVSFRDMYFELERLNGIPEGEVMDAG